MKLYIANCTLQHHDFLYRVPGEEDRRTHMQKIEAGGQIVVYRDETYEVLQGIVDQHLRYGLIDASKIDQTKPFIGLCYSFDKPIPVEKFMYANDHNMGVLEEFGREVRAVQTAATGKALEDIVGPQALTSFETQVIEQNNLDTGLNEGVEFVRDGAQSRRGGKPDNRNNRRR